MTDDAEELRAEAEQPALFLSDEQAEPARSEAPAGAPAKKAPAKKVPAKKVPAKKVPAKKVPATKVPATKVPATKAPATKPPATKAPATKAPATKAAAKKAPAKKAPAKKAPAKIAAASVNTAKTPVKKASMTIEETGPADAATVVLDRSTDRSDDLEPRQQSDRARTYAERLGRRKGLLIAVAVLAALVVALATLLGLLVPTWLHQRDVNAARVSAVKAAKSYAVDFGSYDYQHLDRDFAKVAAHLTPGFKKSYLDSSTKLEPAIVQYQGKSTATVQGLAASSVSTSKATVLVLLDQTVTTAQSRTPRIDRNRLQMNLVKRGGTWLIDKLLLK